MKRPRWTRRQIARLEELREQGVSYAEIARRLRRSPEAVRKKGASRPYDRPMTLADVTRRMGLTDDKTARFWVTRGWLRATHDPTARQRRWYVTEEALEAFITDWRYDFAWTPSMIADPKLREMAEAARREHPRWLTLPEAAERVAVTPLTLYRRYRRGEVPGVKWKLVYINEQALEDAA